MKRVFIYGAIDRFNYGDLLFPLILKEKLGKSGEVWLSYYGILNSDLSVLGAIPTNSLKDLYLDCEKIKDVVLIVAGGEVLQASWGPIYSYLNPYYHKMYHFLNRTLRRYSSGVNDWIAKKIVKAKTERPFVIDPDIFPKLKGIIYNSTGGISSKPYPKHIIKSLQKSLYISCRDEKTYNSLGSEICHLKLFPDSAIMMSSVFDDDFLKEKTSILKKLYFGDDYIFFQINKSVASKLGVEAISLKLNELSANTKKKIVLCPIGTALGHEDNIPLEQIYKKLSKDQTVLVVNPTIWDIMSLISHASLYIGSSLHGVITAMSFAVPYLSIGNLNKVNSYVFTWGVDGLKGDSNLENWDEKIENAIHIERSELTKNRDFQIQLSEKSIEEIKNRL